MSATGGAAPLIPTPERRDRPGIPSPGTAFWNQRDAIATSRGRFEVLSRAVGRPSDLFPYQWAEIAAFALEFRPDLIVELGRGRGNSTCCFTEVANQLGGQSACRVVSLCLSDDWFKVTLPQVKRVVPAEWFAPLEVRECNILQCDVETLLQGAQRCLVFWDAHGFEVAEWVLSTLLPVLADRPHLVLMHDMSDTRFEMPIPGYGQTSLWKGTNGDEPSFLLGHIFTRVSQAISITDFTSRNHLPLHSAMESLHTEVFSDVARSAKLRSRFGEDLFSPQAHWFWFTLNEAPGELTFPPKPVRLAKTEQAGKSLSPAQALWNQRETIAAMGDRLNLLSATVGRVSDMRLYQWAELAAFALEFRPDLIIELGRGRGNSTCCFTEVANRLGGASACRVVSICLSDNWFHATLPRLRHVVPVDWFAPADVRVGDILETDVAALLGSARRCLVFWDAHGFEVAEWVLGKFLPQLAERDHVVLMHDLSDTRFEMSVPTYGETGLWRGANASEPSFLLGHVFSRVAQTISILDFSSRNRMPLNSAAESLHDEIAVDPEKMGALRQLLGDDMFSLQAHWSWFTLDQAVAKPTFPKYTLGDGRKDRLTQSQLGENQMSELTQALGPKLEAEDFDLLANALEAYESELTALCRENKDMETTWKQVQASAGWRMLNSWRGLRDRLAPPESFQRRCYDRSIRSLRGR